jgi:transcription termination factor Rho
MLFLENVNGQKTADIIKKINRLLYVDDKKDMERFKNSQEGILDVSSEGYGFLRTNHYLSGDQDIYVPANQIRRFNLRTGDKIVGKIKMSGENEKYDALLYVETVNGDIPEKIAQRPKFEQLTPIFPNQKITLETDRDVLSTRIIDVFAPVGKGQRGLIVAPPKAGKTILLKEIANGITTNHKEIELIILLVDERPEEVTDISRSVDADIVYSTFDQPPENHIRVAEIVLERGKRLVEQGKDVVILVDSITRMTRANNLVVSPSGRTLSGGLDPESLYFPKKFFGSARKIEEGGSLTILATALLDTGSRMDDVIYEEFKGTGNMELHLERELAERRIYPAINLSRSGTRREELILSEDELKVSFDIRRIYKSSTVYDLTDKMITILERTKNNEAFLHKFLEKYNSQNV